MGQYPAVKPTHSAGDKFASLLDISRRINSEKNFDNLLQILSSESPQLIDAERATIFFFDKSKRKL